MTTPQTALYELILLQIEREAEAEPQFYNVSAAAFEKMAQNIAGNVEMVMRAALPLAAQEALAMNHLHCPRCPWGGYRLAELVEHVEHDHALDTRPWTLSVKPSAGAIIAYRIEKEENVQNRGV